MKSKMKIKIKPSVKVIKRKEPKKLKKIKKEVKETKEVKEETMPELEQDSDKLEPVDIEESKVDSDKLETLEVEPDTEKPVKKSAKLNDADKAYLKANNYEEYLRVYGKDECKDCK